MKILTKQLLQQLEITNTSIKDILLKDISMSMEDAGYEGYKKLIIDFPLKNEFKFRFEFNYQDEFPAEDVVELIEDIKTEQMK